MTVKAVRAIADGRGKKTVVERKNIKIQKKQGGHIGDTELIEGIILDKEPVHNNMPRSVNKPKIALVDAPFEIKKTENFLLQIKEINQGQSRSTGRVGLSLIHI